MGDSLPKVSARDQLTSRSSGPPSYATGTMPSSPAQGAGVRPHPPEHQGEATELACLTNGKGEQIPPDYIAKWKFTDSNKDKRIKEIIYTLNLLKSKKPAELVLNSKSYERSIYLLSRGLYRTHNTHAHNRELVVRLLLDNGAMRLLTTYWAALIQEFEAQRSSVTTHVSGNGELWQRYGEMPARQYIAASLQNCYHLMVIFWNGSDPKNYQTLKQIYDTLGLFLLENLDTYLYPVTSQDNHPQYKIVKAFFGTLHNLCHKYEECIDELRSRRGLAILSRYRNTGSVTLQVKSMLASAYLLQEQDKDQAEAIIELEEVDIKFMITALDDALKGEKYYSKKFGYNVEELISGISNIAAIDCNKSRLVDAGILPVYVRAMKTSDLTIQQEAASGVWVLTFEEKNKSRIISQTDLLSELRKLSQSGNKDVKKAAEGALWKLEGEEKYQRSKEGAASNGTQKQLQHIMISYQWDVQSQVFKIRDRLKQAGYNVWIDVEQMRKSDNTLVAMAQAVENASVVVPVLTEKYKHSAPSRQEASYANSLSKRLLPIRLQPKYRPDGWLAFLLGGAFHYDLYEHQNFENKLQEFLSALGNVAKLASAPTSGEVQVRRPEVVPPQPLIRTIDRPAPTGSVTRSQYSAWSEQQVSDWIKRISLQKYLKQFSGVDGKLLVELATIRATAPDAYYSIMRDENKMSMVDLLKFNSSLSELT